MTDYGTDIKCLIDADELFSEVSGVDVVIQDAFHRLTTDSVLGPGGDDWGYDVRRMIGMSESELTASQPIIAEVLTRDERIKSATVVIRTQVENGQVNAVITADCETNDGPFRMVLPISQVTSATFESL